VKVVSKRVRPYDPATVSHSAPHKDGMIDPLGGRPLPIVRWAESKKSRVSPFRTGDWSAMNAARPAVQLCCLYQLRNRPPSLWMRSILGV
jgi:hypothetical protein